MEDVKKIEEDVIEEHNGVYGGKWHIVSLIRPTRRTGVSEE